MSLQEVILAVQNGLTFKPMDKFDRQAFAGAPASALIASSEVAVYILDGDTITVITDGYQHDYRLGLVNHIEF